MYFFGNFVKVSHSFSRIGARKIFREEKAVKSLLFRKFMNEIFVGIFVGAVHDNNFSFQNLLEEYLHELFNDDSQTDQSDVNKREKMIQFSLLKNERVKSPIPLDVLPGIKSLPAEALSPPSFWNY